VQRLPTKIIAKYLFTQFLILSLLNLILGFTMYRAYKLNEFSGIFLVISAYSVFSICIVAVPAWIYFIFFSRRPWRYGLLLSLSLTVMYNSWSFN